MAHIDRVLFFDATFLRFGGDMRGIPQVIFSLVDILNEPEFRGRVKFLAYPDVAARYLKPRGVPEANIRIVSDVPLLGRIERFHGLFSTWRYRHIAGEAAAVFHAEARSVTRLAIPQIVLWYDFLQIEGRWNPWRKPSRQIFLRYKYGRAARQRESVTISEYTKSQALRHFPNMDPAAIFPVPLGFRGAFGSVAEKPLTLPLSCIYIGSMEARKNVFNMLSHLEDIFGELPFVLHLVGRASDAERKKAEDALLHGQHPGNRKHVVFHGLLSDEKLGALMQECQITLFPSLAEGFGLPLVEAMGRGHLVFAFANTSIPEVGGGALVLAQNNDFKSWGRDLRKLFASPEAAAAFRAKALQRAAFFSEENMKERFREYFRGALMRMGAT